MEHIKDILKRMYPEFTNDGSCNIIHSKEVKNGIKDNTFTRKGLYTGSWKA